MVFGIGVWEYVGLGFIVGRGLTMVRVRGLGWRGGFFVGLVFVREGRFDFEERVGKVRFLRLRKGS